ncbi:MAG: RNA-protein complex protein Nop10 [Desulfurococcaceae archaeon]
MNWLMRRCKNCGRYTLTKERCPHCGGELVVPHPPRFSPVDKYVEYRLRMKLEKRILNLEEKPSYVP